MLAWKVAEAPRDYTHNRGALIVVALAPSSVRADKEKARALFDRATKQYNLGEYATAADAFKAAYDEFPDPTLLYNLAQCERQLGHKQRAITLYRSYLREVTDAPNAAEVHRLIAGLEQDIQREENARKQAVATTAPQKLAPAVAAVPAPLPPRRPWWRNPAGWALVGVAVAVGAVGGGLLGVSQSDQNGAPHAATLADARAQLDQAGAFRSAGFALVGAGAATAIAGVIVLAVMPSRWRARAAIVPSTNGAMMAIGGAL